MINIVVFAFIFYVYNVCRTLSLVVPFKMYIVFRFVFSQREVKRLDFFKFNVF